MKRFTRSLSLLLCLCLFLSGMAFAASAQSYTPGAYTASAQGNNGSLELTVTFSADAITNIVIGAHSETPGICDAPIDRIPAAIIENQSLNVDVISGATNTSKAILEAVEDCVKQAGGDSEALKAIAIENEAVDRVLEADVVIAGAGGAGLSAAVAAAEKGASVIVLEKTDIAGGATGMSAGAITAGARDKDPEGTYTIDMLYDYWIEIGQGKINPVVTRKIADMSVDTLNWLEDMGLPLLSAQTNYIGQEILLVAGALADEARLGSAGMMLIDTLLAKAESLGVTVIYGTPAVRLLTDEAGAVCGIEGIDKLGGKVTVNAGNVVLATGDFIGDVEKMASIRSDVDQVVLVGHKANTGDGIAMATAVGAGEYYGEEVAKGCYGTAAAGFGNYQIGMNVNKTGERFMDEGSFYGRYYTILRNQIKEGNAPFWELFDSATPYTQDCEEAVAAGTMVKADTLEELAGLIGVDAGALVATAAAYDAMEGREDTQFGKLPELMYGMSEAPFYATNVYALALGSYGGLKIDEEARILKGDGSFIPGLYGAGDLVLGSFMVDEYPYSGSCIQYALSTGRIAGANAAE